MSRQLFAPLLFLLGLPASACQGEGQGTVGGALYLRGCPDEGTAAAPPPFDLAPTFFAAEVLAADRPDEDPRVVDRMVIRLQRSSHKPERTDVFELFLFDLGGLTDAGHLGKQLPIIPPPLGGPWVPLPQVSGPQVRASIALNGTCPMARVQPGLIGDPGKGGYILFHELGRGLGERVAAEFHNLIVDDPRGDRLMLPEGQKDAAGQLGGSFDFEIRAGPAAETP